MSGSTAPQDPQTWTTLCQGDVVRESNDTLKHGMRYLPVVSPLDSDSSQLDDADLHCHPSATPQVLNKYLKDNELTRHHVILAASAYTNLIAHESALHLVDRPLSYGAIVKKSPKDLQSGTVLDLGGTYDVAHSFTTVENDETPCDPKRIVKDVASEDIVFSREWEIGDYLIWKNCWLGEVVELIETVTICLSNNSVVAVEVPGQLKLKRTKPHGFPNPVSAETGTGTPPAANMTLMGGLGADVYALLDRFLPREPDQDEPFDFEIGQIVETSKGNLRRGKWRFGAYDPNIEPVGKVVEVRTISLCIEWICQNMMVRTRFVPIEPPEPWVSDGEEAWFQLKKFNRQSDGGADLKTINLERYDRVRFKDLDAAIEKYNSSNSNGYGMVERVPRSATLGYDVNEFMVIARSSWATIQWQDLTITRERSVDLIRCDSSDEHELWPGDFVITKPETGSAPQTLTAPPSTQEQLISVPSNNNSNNNHLGVDEVDPPLVFVSPERLGVIQSVDAARRIARVRWFRSPKVELAGEMIIPGSSTGQLEEATTEEVSMYEVAAHPALSICRGDFVLVAPEQVVEDPTVGPSNASSSSQSTSSADATAAARTSQTGQQSNISAISEALRGIVDTGLIANLSASLINTTNPQLHTLSRMLHQFPLGLRSDIGQQPPPPAAPVTNTALDWFGEVVDKGLDGLVTVRLGALDDIRTIRVPIERLTVVFDGEDFDDEDEDGTDDSVNMGSSDSENSGSDTSMGADDWISEQIFYEGGEPMEAGNEADWLTDEENASDIEEMEVDHLVDGADLNSPTDTPNPQAEGSTISATIKNTSLNKAASASPPRFSILEAAIPSDHAFVAQPALEQSLAFLRRINKEHKILQTTLPEGIFVRTWESRLDLLRVLIVGPRNTPYELAPFVFDFHLGPTFPSTPPTGYFHSWTNGIGRVNPNLYEDGKICLSLLGTWHGEKRSENWSSSGSSILQVLVSLMGLVLVKEPYYNEAGFNVYLGAEEATVNANLYSERAYILSRGFVKRVLEKPVLGLEDILTWLYDPKSDGGMTLLGEIVRKGKDIVAGCESARSAHPGSAAEISALTSTEIDGIPKLTEGAVVLLKKTLTSLDEILIKALQEQQ
ncbi:hypothetical protein AOL_s00109g159 [Orbilia oligospora ATCC 24927]|uniref:UBC core domain-containing protein n=1 Tax=Arthrobotrys oligospora (strain ATCC 24927 / CBS 115.81 / DSM 1491) TaxID=756982 RepID=G1XKD0_ARTOA|nr:hypothetical protein AOL_s00109g159 [Orbilia oligospora ATCC 24927]EGX46401.1 hypothetical protein AOL_s00109g159 [Orbilia oligospora ATCC 24927]